MADNITRCPKCATAFRISDAHLKSAKGIVRCGSCLALFNARDHLEIKRSTPAPAPSATETASKAPTKPTTVQQPRARAIPAQPAVHEPPSAISGPAVSLFEYERQPFEGTLEDYDPGESDEDEVEDDEAWALELLKDDSDLNVQFKKVVPAPSQPEAKSHNSASSDEPEHSTAGDEDDPSPMRPSPPPRVPVSAIRAEADGIEHAHASTQRTATASTPTPSDATQPENSEPYHGTPQKVPSTSAPAANTAAPADGAPAPTVKGKPLDRETLKHMLAAIEPDSLEVEFPQEAQVWYKRLLWPGLVLAALLVLTAQVAWLEFDRLSRIEPYRSGYAVICKVLNCDLPELKDRRLIQTSNLIVRSHPEVADALAIDVMLQNNAAFEQSFPALQLTFTDLQGEPVAIQRFTPEQYLGGELAGHNQMPVRQPIHIAMEIEDPGPSAVNYNVVIVD